MQPSIPCIPCNRRPHWRPWAALAVLTACGGTSGLENIVVGDASSMDVTSTVVDSPVRAESSVATDGSVVTDATHSDGSDYDRTVPGRPPAQDTGVPPATMDSGGRPAPMDAGSILTSDGALPTTLDILAALTDGSVVLGADGGVQVSDGATIPPCVACFLTPGYSCNDPTAGGGTCETIYDAGMAVTHFGGTLDGGDTCTSLGLGAGVSERTVCLQTLSAIFSSRCGKSFQLTPCLCGMSDPTMCLAGSVTPTGPVYETYACDFNSARGSDINTNFLLQSFGAGMANGIVQCLGAFNTDPNCCSCFGGALNDGGNCIVH